MSKKLYVGSLPFEVTEDQLHDLFKDYGSVGRVQLISDRDTGRSKGFGFVEFGDDSEAEAAIQKLNGTQCGSRTLVVNEARPMEKRSGGGFGGGGGGRGGGFGGGGGRGGDRGGGRRY